MSHLFYPPKSLCQLSEGSVRKTARWTLLLQKYQLLEKKQRSC